MTLLSLPLDITSEISVYLSQYSLANLCRVSRASKDTFTARLYQHADILSCTDNGLPNNDDTAGPQGTPSDTCRRHSQSALARSRQKAFVSSLLIHPIHSSYIRSLRFAPFLHGLSESEINEKGLWLLPQPLVKPVWEVFSGLTRLQHLDLCYSYDQPTLDIPASLKAPAQRIASLQSLRLSCAVTPRFATILGASLDPKNLATIELDNLQEKTQEHAYRGLIPKGEFPEGPELDLLRSPMSILLVQLTGKCPKLQNFQMRKIGQNFPYERHPWADSVDEHIYEDCAIFLASVRGTLQTLVFQQDLPGYWNTWDEAGQSKDARRLYEETMWFMAPEHERTMDRRFQELLLPILLQDRWEALRKLEIRGVGHGFSAVVKGLEERLRGVVPHEAELVVELAECILQAKPEGPEFRQTKNAKYNTRKAK